MKYLHTLTLLIEQGRKSAAPEVRKAAEESRKSLDEIRQYVRDDFNYYAKEKGFWETDVYDRLRWRVALEIMSLEEKLCVR